MFCINGYLYACNSGTIKHVAAWNFLNLGHRFFWNSPAELDTLFDTALIVAFHFRCFPTADGGVLENARDSFAEATVPRTRISTVSCHFQCLSSPMGTRLTLARLCGSLACALRI